MNSPEHDPHGQDGRERQVPSVHREEGRELTRTGEMLGHEEHAAHDKHAGHSVAMFRDRFWLSVLLSVPVLIWSEMVQEWLGYTAPSFTLSDRIPAVFGTIVFVYGGLPFLKGGVQEARDRQPGMMLLISLAILVAFASSVASEFGALDLEFWWELALLIDVMLLGHWQEMKAIGQAPGALAALAALMPDEAERGRRETAASRRSGRRARGWATSCSSVPEVASPPTGRSSKARPSSTSR